MPVQNFIVIEDDRALAAQFKSMLELEKFSVKVFHSAEDFILGNSDISARPHIYLIDLNLPGLRGSEIVKLIRYKDKISPIFIISGASPDVALKECMSAGADDYITKPYNPDHLLMKILNAQSKLGFLMSAMMEFGVKLLPEAKLISRDGNKKKLTNREFAIVEKLLSVPDQVHSREVIIREIGDCEITERTIDVHVSSLRKKIAPLQLEIETCRGKGYRIKGVDRQPVAV